MSAVQKHAVTEKVSDLLTFKKKKIEKWNKKSQPQKLNSFTFSPTADGQEIQLSIAPCFIMDCTYGKAFAGRGDRERRF